MGGCFVARDSRLTITHTLVYSTRECYCCQPEATRPGRHRKETVRHLQSRVECLLIGCTTQVQWPTSLGDVQRPKILLVLPFGIFRERSQWWDVELVRVFRTALPPDIYVGPVVL
jgi:hypothetical protein